MKEILEYDVRYIADLQLQAHCKNMAQDSSALDNLKREHQRQYPLAPNYRRNNLIEMAIYLLCLLPSIIAPAIFIVSLLFLDPGWLALLASSTLIPVSCIIKKQTKKTRRKQEERLAVDPNYKSLQDLKMQTHTQLCGTDTIQKLCDQAIVYGKIRPAVQTLIAAVRARIVNTTLHLPYAQRLAYSEGLANVVTKTNIWPILTTQEQSQLRSDIVELTRDADQSLTSHTQKRLLQLKTS